MIFIKKTKQIHCIFVQPLWKTLWKSLKKLKMELPYDPEMPLQGIFPKSPKTLIQKIICTPLFTATLFTTARPQKQPKCPPIDK